MAVIDVGWAIGMRELQKVGRTGPSSLVTVILIWEGTMDHFRPDELLFEIPVYRVSLDAYHDEYRALVDEAIEELAGSWEWAQRSPGDLRDYVERWARPLHGRPYWYNQMIGVIRLYQDGGSIKAEFWGQPQRGFRRDFRHKGYMHRGRVFEYHSGPVAVSSIQIYQELLDRLLGLTSPGNRFARRHVDLNSFKRVGPEINWLKVLGWTSPESDG